MLVLGIFSLMTAVALPNVNISPLLLTRVASIVLLYAAALSFNALDIQAIGSGVSIYSGLFQVTSVSQSIDTFIFIVGAITFYLGHLLQMQSWLDLVQYLQLCLLLQNTL